LLSFRSSSRRPRLSGAQEAPDLDHEVPARKTVAVDIDGEKRRVRKGDLREASDPLRSLADAEPVQVEE